MCYKSLIPKNEKGLHFSSSPKPTNNIIVILYRYKRRLLLAESQLDNIPGKSEKKFTARPMMTDEHKLKQRQKQIDFGKNTIAYGRYCEAVPRYI